MESKVYGENGFTGMWVLDLELTEQIRAAKGYNTKADLLRQMGRNQFEISVIDKANERFRLIHMRKPGEKHVVHMFDKKVRIFLDSRLLKSVAAVTNLIGGVIKPVDQVHYHDILHNAGIQKHAPDQKRFGECTTLSTFDEDTQTFVIRWNLSQGLLKVSHIVSPQDKLEVVMDFYGSRDPQTELPLARSIKVYKRVPMEESDQKALATHKHVQYVV
jgi:hypothetical protein